MPIEGRLSIRGDWKEEKKEREKEETPKTSGGTQGAEKYGRQADRRIKTKASLRNVDPIKKGESVGRQKHFKLQKRQTWVWQKQEKSELRALPRPNRKKSVSCRRSGCGGVRKSGGRRMGRGLFSRTIPKNSDTHPRLRRGKKLRRREERK